MIRYIGKRFFVRLVLLTAVILGVVGLFSWAEGGPTKKLGLSLFRETQYVYVDRGITVPVSGKAAQGTIRALAEADNVVIACGGGGIPVIATDHHHLKGAAAVIDKDLASELLAEHLDADMLIILTAVEKVAVNFNKPNQKWLDALTPEEARTYIGEGQFAPGSMLPKVEAAVKFAESKPGRTALITLLEKARDGIDGKTGTRISL